MSQQSTKPRAQSRTENTPRKVVEIGVHITASQLRRLEMMMQKWGVKMAVLPECDPPYRNLTEWYAECSGEEGSKA